MKRRVIVSVVAAAVAFGVSLVGTSGPAAAQGEWNRPVTMSGPVEPVQVGSLGTAFWAPSIYTAGSVDMAQVGIYWATPMDITLGPRGEDTTAGTYGGAFRTGPANRPR
jgi:hypothetical protein